MKKTLLDGWKSLLRLLRFVFWYGFAVAVLLYLLPAAGLLLEQHYEALSSTVKFFR
jgi:4-hydroxybenzoate polyprenyltransferase